MAKVRSIIGFSGTIDGLTFVDSNTYAPHTRAKRGTYKPVSLNEGMKKSSAVQTQVNLMAKLIFDPVKDFAPRLKNGKLWPKLLSVFRQQQKQGKSYCYSGFHRLEMRTEYPASKHGFFSLIKDPERGLLLHCQLVNDNDYRIRLLRIATDSTLLAPYATEVRTVDLKAGDQQYQVPFEFTELPSDARTLYVLHCEKLIKGVPADLLASGGARFLFLA